MTTILHNVMGRGGWKRFLYVLLVSIAGLPLLASSQTPVQTEIAKLLASEQLQDSWFGRSVALDGDVAVIGAPNIGASAHVFEFISGTWIETTMLSDHEPYYSGFGTSVDVSDRTVLVGIPYYDACGTSSGAAFLFEDTTGEWVVAEELTPVPCDIGGIVGSAVSLDGDIAVLGAPGFDDYRGTVYVYEHRDGVWTQLAALLASSGAAGHEFGSAVAVSGDYLVVGAPRASGGGWMKGAAYVFERHDDTWIEVQELTASEGVNFDYFGSSVAVSGPYAAVGSWQDDFGGSVYMFERIAGSWVEIGPLRPLDAGSSQFGVSIAVGGEAVVIGAPGAVINEGPTGAAYVFERLEGAWTEKIKLVSTDAAVGDGVGSSVAMSGDIVLVGAQMDTNLVPTSGSAYVFDIGVPQPGCDPVVDPPTLDFGEIKVGETVTLATTLTNEGGEACDVTAYVDSPSGEFALNPGSPDSFTVATGESADVLVDYGPVDMGDDTGALELAIADPPSQIDVPLTGSAAVEVFDLDIAQFRTSRSVRYREDTTRPVTITLSVSNEGTLPGSVLATVVGVRADSEVYREILEVTDEVGGAPQPFAFPDYVPTAAGDITWTATLDDGYPDVDESIATTRVW